MRINDPVKRTSRTRGVVYNHVFPVMHLMVASDWDVKVGPDVGVQSPPEPFTVYVESMGRVNGLAYGPSGVAAGR